MKNFNTTLILSCLIIASTLNSCKSSPKSPMTNAVARMEVKEPIEGVCDNDNVIVVLPFISSGQTEAVAPMTDEQLEKELNSSVTFLKDKKDYEDKGMLNIIINCKGEMVRCEIDNKTKSADLDNEILAVFLKMKVWKAAKMGSKSVDSMVLYSFTIENGKIKF